MKVHLFQRYSQRENVDTANTMLLLSRLYEYSHEIFFKFLTLETRPDWDDLDVRFRTQEKNKDSVPDATITQDSFKIVVETKRGDWFSEGQLERHLKSFSHENYKVLITLAPKKMNEKQKGEFDKKLGEFNNKYLVNKPEIIHINTTFAELTNQIDQLLDENRDYVMKEILDDYIDYCRKEKLVSDAGKYMKVQLTGATFDFNIDKNVYYSKGGYRPHEILGLYRDKSVRRIGKIVAKIVAYDPGDGMEYKCLDDCELTDERKEIIEEAIEDGLSHGWDIRRIPHTYFFVDNFYETDFKKVSKGAPFGPRIFDLTQVLGFDKLPDIEEIANRLRDKTWD